jgi:hypothetical protein
VAVSAAHPIADLPYLNDRRHSRHHDCRRHDTHAQFCRSVDPSILPIWKHDSFVTMIVHGSAEPCSCSGTWSVGHPNTCRVCTTGWQGSACLGCQCGSSLKCGTHLVSSPGRHMWAWLVAETFSRVPTPPPPGWIPRSAEGVAWGKEPYRRRPLLMLTVIRVGMAAQDGTPVCVI